MRGAWAWVLLSLCVPAVYAAAPRLSAPLSSGGSAIITSDFELQIVVRPHNGDAGSRLALRLTGDASNWQQIAAYNNIQQLRTDRDVRIPLSMVRPELQRDALSALFPADSVTSRGWFHRVVLESRGEGESYWSLASWFTGDAANYARIRGANADKGLATRRGDVIIIPAELLATSLRTAAMKTGVTKSTSAVGTSRTHPPEKVTATSADVPAQQATTVRRTQRDRAPAALEASERPAPVAESSKVSDVLVVAPAELPLTFEQRDDKEYAVYRLRRGEALYSSVAVRFTGRVFARDVNEVVEKIVQASDIDDVARIAVNTPIRIPMELLASEFLPRSDTRRVAYEESKRASARAARRVEAKDLRGVRIVLDAGHGGRDVGTTHEDLWESTYVYDVMCRLRELIEKKSAARVSITTRSKDAGCAPSTGDRPRNRTDHIVVTEPEYPLEDATVGVNLRWYLANSWYRRAISDGVAPEKVVFISIHADSLHPSLRGAMAYIPGQQYSTGSFTKRGKVYLSRAEVRENPVVSQTSEEALRAEGLSRQLAESIVDAFTRAELPVHPFKPVREHVVRDGKEWVPAIIRYNKVPTRLLLEICNLGNEDDRKAVRTRKYRQALAESIYDGIADFFEGRDSRPAAGRVATTSAK